MSDDDNIKIDFDYREDKYDDSNKLALPTDRKRKRENQKNDKSKVTAKKLLTNRERRKLEKTVQLKKKKLERSDLWKELEAESHKNIAEVQHTASIFSQNRNKDKKMEKAASRASGQGKAKSWRGMSTDNPEEREGGSSTDTDDYSTDESVGIAQEKEDVMELDDALQKQVDSASLVTKDTMDKAEAEETSDDITKVTMDEKKDGPVNATPTRFMLVDRDPVIQAARLQLPIIAEEQVIMETISENDVVVLCGATGCGKTTQLPQFLYEAGYTRDGMKIAITEPRRVAAVAMSHRVAKELNLPESKVSYQIRYEGNVTHETEIKFMTDGVLLQEIKKDFNLSSYSAVLVDEAHERSIYTDILLGLLSLIVRLRRSTTCLPPLKLIVMSATLRVTDFTENPRLFVSPRPALVKLEARQFPVTCRFAKATHEDYLKAAYRKIISVHREQPESGGILVFVTGQQEVSTLSRWLRAAFPPLGVDSGSYSSLTKERQGDRKARVKLQREIIDQESSEIEPIRLENFDIIPADEESEMSETRRVARHPSDNEDVGTSIAGADSEASDEDEMPEENTEMQEGDSHEKLAPLHVLPLYSLLNADKQSRVFEDPPPGHRLVVVATNVAETSITIPNIRYVVDTGKVKLKVYDRVTGISRFVIAWTSRASAEQRAGRAGRLGPGVCYRLFSSRIFQDELAEFSPPEITLKPLDEVVLMLKNYLGSTVISRFPLVTAPSDEAVKAAEVRLIALDALEMNTTEKRDVTIITRAGRWMSRLPLAPRFARMLLLSNQAGLLPYTVLLVACLSVPELLVPTLDSQEVDEETPDNKTLSQLNKVRREFQRQFVRKEEELQLGDLCVLIGAVCCLERHSVKLTTESGASVEDQVRLMADRHGVRWKAYTQVRQLRKQITDILNANVVGLELSIDPLLSKPSPEQFSQLRQIVLAGSVFQVARKVDPAAAADAKEKKQLRHAYQCGLTEDLVFIHPQSVLFKESYQFVVFQDLHYSAKPYMKGVCSIDPCWLPLVAPSLCRVTSPMVDENDNTSPPLPVPSYDALRDEMMCHAKSITFGPRHWLLDPATTIVPLSVAGSSVGGGGSLTTAAYRWFARALLEGNVVPIFGEWRDKFKTTCPTKLTTVSWGMIRPQVKQLISELVKNKVVSRKSLEQKWSTDPKFLLEAYGSWLKESEKIFLSEVWPPITRTKTPKDALEYI